jgi:hypothetical protein
MPTEEPVGRCAQVFPNHVGNADAVTHEKG